MIKDSQSVPVCPVHEESFKRIETLVTGELKALSTVVRANIGNQAALNTRFEKLIDRLEDTQKRDAERVQRIVDKAFEARCTGPDNAKRIGNLEKRFWVWAGGLGVLIFIVNIGAYLVVRLLT